LQVHSNGDLKHFENKVKSKPCHSNKHFEDDTTACTKYI